MEKPNTPIFLHSCQQRCQLVPWRPIHVLEMASIVFVTITFRLVAYGRCRLSPPSAGEPKSAEQGMQNVEVSDITQQLLHSALDILHSIFNSDRFKYRTSMTSPPNFKRNTILTTTLIILAHHNCVEQKRKGYDNEYSHGDRSFFQVFSLVFSQRPIEFTFRPSHSL
jgi:hypothetical protein